MWGNILTEVSFQPNFNIGFSNTRTDILIHLTQWQYWWWFWFTFIWVLYYFIIMRIFRARSLKFKPRIATTFRPRGKWGDLLVCLIPISWCVNILINSNFLLKLIEWQNESSLFTIRIRGRQWYWVYKFDLKNVTDIISAPKNIGRNKWGLFFGGDLEMSDNYLHIIQLRSQNKWIKKYWLDIFSKENKKKNFNINSPFEKLILNKNSFYNKDDFNFYFYSFFKYNTKNNFLKLYNNTFFDFVELFNNLKNNENLNFFKNYLNNNQSLSYLEYFNTKINKNKIKLKNFYYNTVFLNNNYFNNFELLNFSEFNELDRFQKKTYGVKLPLQTIKYDLSKINDSDFMLFKLKINDGNSNVINKVIPHTVFLTIKQKKYKRKKKINDFVIFLKDDFGKKTKNVKYSGKLFLNNNNIILDDFKDSAQYYNMLKKNRKRGENIPIVYSKRMLRTQRTLVLPAHVNITAITNSYDVVHSWFIPGLGIKLDCIPGRATHHTFFVDNVGFYYGQCAEICGRYHHHMPIRICALPFEHFLVWWHSFGLPKLLFTNSQKRNELNYSFRKFTW